MLVVSDAGRFWQGSSPWNGFYGTEPYSCHYGMSKNGLNSSKSNQEVVSLFKNISVPNHIFFFQIKWSTFDITLLWYHRVNTAMIFLTAGCGCKGKSSIEHRPSLPVLEANNCNVQRWRSLLDACDDWVCLVLTQKSITINSPGLQLNRQQSGCRGSFHTLTVCVCVGNGGLS